jgi:Ca-activated chloride channel family protein
MAADRGVRVYTVGFGTLQGTTIGFEDYQIYVRLDEDTLKAIAKITGGEYFHAGTANDLRTVYQNLNAKLALERQQTEIGAIFSGVAALLALLAALLSVWWFGRGPAPMRVTPPA